MILKVKFQENELKLNVSFKPLIEELDFKFEEVVAVEKYNMNEYGNATPNDVVKGVKFTSADGVALTGTRTFPVVSIPTAGTLRIV